MPLLDMQRKGQQIGRIRIGQKIATDKKDRNGNVIFRPVKLDTFRLTTGSRQSADVAAAVLGGKVQQWERGQWEVITERDALMVTVPPRDEAISQNYEMWSKGGCIRRCDSQTEQISGKPCLCPSDPLERDRLAKLKTPAACKPITRLSVQIPDLLGLGVWRIDTGSYYAAVELGDSAELMQAARDMGVFLPAVLRIDHRERVAGGQTKKFPVPVLEVLATFRDIATGAIARGGIAAQLPPSMQPAKAIEAAATPAATAPQAKPQRHEQVTAQGIADQAAKATTRAEIEDLAALASDEELLQDHADTGDGAIEELDAFLKHRWKTLPRPAEDDEEGGAA